MVQAQSGPRTAILYQSCARVPEASLQTLATVYQSFAKELTVQLSAYLRFAVNVGFEGTAECGFTPYLSERNVNACAGSMTAQSLDSQMVADIEPSVFYAFIELMMGGKPAPRALPNRPPSGIEKQLAAIVFRTLAAELERAWSSITPVPLRFNGIETTTQLARLLPPGALMIAARFQVQVGELSGVFTILTEAEPVNRLLRGLEQPVEILEAEVAPSDFSQTILEARVSVDVWLDNVEIQLRDLIHLREGYVIKFDHPTERRLECLINGESGFSGQIVSTGRRRAFLIQDADIVA